MKRIFFGMMLIIVLVLPTAFADTIDLYQIDQSTISLNGTPTTVNYNNGADFDDNWINDIGSTSSADVSEGKLNLDITDAEEAKNGPAILLNSVFTLYSTDVQTGDTGYWQMLFSKPSLPLSGSDFIGMNINSGDYWENIWLDFFYEDRDGDDDYILVFSASGDSEIELEIGSTAVAWSDIGATFGFRMDISTTGVLSASYDWNIDGVPSWTPFDYTASIYSSADKSYNMIAEVDFNPLGGLGGGSVPEPNTIFLIFFGLLSFGWRLRRKTLI